MVSSLRSTGTFSFALQGFTDKHIVSPISLRRGYQLVTGKMRSCNFPGLGFFRWYSQSNHTFNWKLLKDKPQGPKFSGKVSVFACYNSTHDLYGNGESQRVFANDINHLVDEFDLALTCERFPSIVLGDSAMLELYDKTQKEKINILFEESFKKYKSSPVHNLIESKEHSDGLSITGLSLSNVNTTSIENHSTLPNSPYVVSAQGEADISSVEDPLLSLSAVPLGVSMPCMLTLDKPIKSFPGISIRFSRQLENGGFHTARKLLHHFPRTYADLQNVHSSSVDGQYLILVGTVLSSRGIKAGSSFSFLEVVVSCEMVNPETCIHENEDCHMEDEKIIYLHLKRFFSGNRFTNRPFLQSLQSKYKEGDCVYVSGKVKKMRTKGHFEMRQFTIDVLDQEDEGSSHIERIPYPIYPSKVGLKPEFLKDMISRVLKVIPVDIDPIPTNVLEEFGLLNLKNAYLGIHCPRDKNEADLARRRFIFDEFFYLQLARLFQMLDSLGTWDERDGLLDKYRNQRINAVPREEWSTITKKFLEVLPFSLTSSQLNAVSEIIWDLWRPVPMNRLLQGDVGCGKTVVAFLACMEVIGSGFQAAFMVPTELLAIQHYEHFISFLENIGDDEHKPSVALLTGSTSSKQSRLIREGIQTGDIAMVIGTHSLISEKIEFSNLRIAVIDEQHRFGVLQRGKFNSKLYSSSANLDDTGSEASMDKANMAPHVLAMSATPIPRTLALALYGDVSLTQITDLLPGRVAVETFAIEGNEGGFEKVYQMIRDELVGGGKVYLVYPVIEKSEQLPQLQAATSEHRFISEKFMGYKCGLLHGRMKSDEKVEVLKCFRSGDTRILLATQVIEIGIDVVDASMMVVMNAERFGTAQLHQLRGRVGRGEKKSRCVFLSSTDKTLDRLKVLEKSSDGFYLANVDLLLRGPGNLLGKRQSGHLPDFPVTRLEIDGSILQEAHLAALKVLSISNDLKSFPMLKVELSMRQPLCLLGD